MYSILSPRPAALFIPVVAVAYSIKEVESYLQAILLWELKHNMLTEIQRESSARADIASAHA